MAAKGKGKIGKLVDKIRKGVRELGSGLGALVPRPQPQLVPIPVRVRPPRRRPF